MAKITFQDKKVITPKFRASYPHLWEAKAFKGSKDAKFSIVMLFDKKKVDISDLKKAADKAGIEKWGPDKAKWPAEMTMPFRDGDKEKKLTKEKKGMWIVSAKSKDQPQVVDKNREPIIDKRDFYAGCYAHASVVAFAWERGEDEGGISFALLSVIKAGDGEKLSGRKDASEEFADLEIEDDSEDESSYGSDDDSEEGDGGF